MNKDRFIKEGKINYIIARPENGRTQFLKILMDEYKEGISVNLKPNNLQGACENIYKVPNPTKLGDIDFEGYNVIFLNNATVLGRYNNSPSRVYEILKEINTKTKATIICVESYITFLDNERQLLSNADNILQLHRRYYYTKEEKDRLKIFVEVHSNMHNYSEFTNDVIEFEDPLLKENEEEVKE